MLKPSAAAAWHEKSPTQPSCVGDFFISVGLPPRALHRPRASSPTCGQRGCKPNDVQGKGRRAGDVSDKRYGHGRGGSSHGACALPTAVGNVTHGRGRRYTWPWTTLHMAVDNVDHGRGQRTKPLLDMAKPVSIPVSGLVKTGWLLVMLPVGRGNAPRPLAMRFFILRKPRNCVWLATTSRSKGRTGGTWRRGASSVAQGGQAAASTAGRGFYKHKSVTAGNPPHRRGCPR